MSSDDQDPAPAPASRPSRDGRDALGETRGEDLEALRRRLDDHATLLRKNQQALSELAESVARLVTSQRRRERWMNVNSFVAYLIFTVLLGGAFLTLYRSRARELVTARDTAVHERDDARARARSLDDTLMKRDQGQKTAFEYFQLLQDGKRAEAVARYGELDPAALTPTEKLVFEQGHKQAREALVDAGYLAGLDAAKDGDQAKAISELKRALAYEEEGPRAAQMRYYLGVAFVKTKEPEKGKHELELALAGRVEQSGAVDARFWLATALEAMGDLAAARTEYDKFASAQPNHPLSVAARRKSMALARHVTPTN